MKKVQLHCPLSVRRWLSGCCLKAIGCLLLCISLSACGDGLFGKGTADKDGLSGSDRAADQAAISGDSPASPIAQGREWVYVPEVFTVGDASADYGGMQPVGDTLCYVVQGETENSTKSICRYSLSDGGLERIPINWPEGGNDWDAGYRFFTPDAGLYMTANVYPADSGSMKRFLCRFDPEGNCLFSRDITEQAGGNVSLWELSVDGQGRLYLFLDNGEMLLYTGDGDYHGSVSYRSAGGSSSENQTSAQIRGTCDGADGKFYVCISEERVGIPGGNAEESGRCTLMEIDFENAGLTEAAGNLPNIRGLCGGMRRGSESAGQGGSAGSDSHSTGNGSGAARQDGGSGSDSEDLRSRYDLLLYDDRAVYGYNFDLHKKDSGSAGEELFLWMDSDINGYCAANLYLLEDGRLCATVEDWLNDDRVIVVLKRTRAEQAPGREELVLATVNGGSELAAMAVKFNRGSGQYHITVKNYEALTDLYNAILTKEPMDLIDLSGLDVRKLSARGLFEDLTPYVEQSEAFEPSDFVEGLLDAYTFDNILTGIPAEFMIRTVVGKASQLDNKAGLTLEELLAAAERYPGAKIFNSLTKAEVTREEMMQYLMMFNEDAFIDWDTGVCDFDSDRFKEVLAYVSRFPDSAAGGREEEPLSARVQNGEVLFITAELYPPFIMWDYVKMFGEDAVCAGFPTPDGRGGHLLLSGNVYGIAAVSEHKESAWSFIEESLTQEKGELYAEFWLTYPALKRKLEERAEAALEREELNREDLDMVLSLLPNAMPLFSAEGDEVIKIINEEAPACYSGQKGADDVVSVIQNRIQLYVNENR